MWNNSRLYFMKDIKIGIIRKFSKLCDVKDKELFFKLLIFKQFEQLQRSVRHVQTILFPVPRMHSSTPDDQHDLWITTIRVSRINLWLWKYNVTFSDIVNSLLDLHTWWWRWWTRVGGLCQGLAITWWIIIVTRIASDAQNCFLKLEYCCQEDPPPFLHVLCML